MTIEDAGAPPPENGEFWLFGYGSLIWKPPPHFDRRIPGWVEGYVRRFWQASQDHRGTPEAPGRVVTLIEHAHWATLRDPHPAPPHAKVWGVAYRIEAAHVTEVKEYLDIREINGYSIHYTPFHPASTTTTTSPSQSSAATAPIRALVYIGTPENDQFTGPQEDIQALAEHIYRSEGPSGLNRDYLLGLDAALAELGAEDVHVADLATRVRALMARDGVAGKEEEEDDVAAAEQAKGHTQNGVLDEQEETEKVS